MNASKRLPNTLSTKEKQAHLVERTYNCIYANQLNAMRRVKLHTSQLVLGNAFLVASAEVCASHHLDRTPSPNMKTFQSQNGYTMSEGKDGPNTAIFLFLSEREAISYGWLVMLYP